MGKVLEIGICRDKGSEIVSVSEVEAIQGKGLINDRKYKKNNDKTKQITLIENESIKKYNELLKKKIPGLKFRRNIITKDISLNNLVNKVFFIGGVKIKAHDFCRPCKYLQDLLKEKALVKKLLTTGGLRCEILSDGKIFVGDDIRQ
jgi:MOSC domain-containing protein YiiM